MATEEQLRDANRLSSLTYMISACLNFSIENLNGQLERCNLKLAGEDRRLFNRVQTQISQLQSNLKILEGLAFNVLKDDEAKLAYEDATHIYWVVFMILIDRGGTDALCDLRFKAFVDMISKYKSLLKLPGIDIAYHSAFAMVSRAIQEGKYSKEDFKDLLHLKEILQYEDRTEEDKSKIPG